MGGALRLEQVSAAMEEWNNSLAGPQTVATKCELNSALSLGSAWGGLHRVHHCFYWGKENNYF